MIKSKLLAIIVSGILTVLTIAVVISCMVLVSWIFANFSADKIMKCIISSATLIFAISIIWIGIYDKIKK